MPTPAMPKPSWNSWADYTLTFHDEFTGRSHNSAWQNTWWPYSGPNGISGGGMYMCAAYAASHVTMPDDGYLHMLLDNTPNICRNYNGSKQQVQYTGAIMHTHGNFSQVGGSFEARIYLPSDSSGRVYGWPAWWLLDNSWSGEHDILEGGAPAADNGGTAAHVRYGTDAGWQSPTPYCGWHTFGMYWNTGAQTSTFYWDGKQVWSHAFTATKPEYLIFDYQMSANAIPPPPGGAVMLVDWVRVWK